ncbi:decapping and exoribonuclease protein-like [Athalia rosae]|uniref:decapping and exoribonuclease protein-like n=1 Tax=Athalia rosae TaxID=37344 RepID=UPI002033AF1C|nr:decapping and exoribonuclease protein-like [Athalia rosae]
MEVHRFRVVRSDFPNFSRREVIGYYSLDGNRKFMPSTAQLKYLVRPSDINTEIDLKKGYHLYQRKPAAADEEKLENLLYWILLHTPKIRANQGSDRWLQPHFICYRGLLTTICCSPFEKKEGWIICASKWRGTIYLNAFDTVEKQHYKKNISEDELKFMSWGYKFEQYLLTGSPGQIPDTSQAVNEALQFNCIFKSTLAEHKLLYGAEIDGVVSDEVLVEPIAWENIKLVELKTKKIMHLPKQHHLFRKTNLMKWWCQSFLVGIENVLCGFRDDNGFVRKITSFNVAEMPIMSKGLWDASTCINFGNDFLRFVKSVVKEDYDKNVYKFEWAPGRNVQVEVFPGECEYSVLPQWFINDAEPYNCIN